jgi:hypothetical protein
MKRAGCVLTAVMLWMVWIGGHSFATSSEAPIGSPAGDVGIASFEGARLDLSRGWGAARACLVYPGRRTECFRTQAALDARVASLAPPALSCSTPLRLRDGTYQSGTTVSIFPRGIWINLSTLGFDNKTSSYTVGACSIELAALSNGGGAHYAWCLFAGCVENVMVSGWDNVVSSVYLH